MEEVVRDVLRSDAGISEDSLPDEIWLDNRNDLLKRAEGRIRLLKKSYPRIRLLKKSGEEEKLSNQLGGTIRIL